MERIACEKEIYEKLLKRRNLVMPWEDEMYQTIAGEFAALIVPDKTKRAVITVYRTIEGCKRDIDKRLATLSMEHTLNILVSCGLNLDEFMNSELYNKPYTDLMLMHVQSVIDGYSIKSGGRRVPRKSALDLGKTACTYENGELLIVSDGRTYRYRKDEHCLIYFNGKTVFKYPKVLTPKEERDALVSFMEDQRSDRLGHERRMRRSMEYARTFYVKA